MGNHGIFHRDLKPRTQFRCAWWDYPAWNRDLTWHQTGGTHKVMALYSSFTTWYHLQKIHTDSHTSYFTGVKLWAIEFSLMTAVSSPSEEVQRSIGSYVELVWTCSKDQVSCVWLGNRRPLLRYVSREAYHRRRETFHMSPHSLLHLAVIGA